jgi:tetrapyrrole methylase family protein/MazG family protein
MAEPEGSFQIDDVVQGIVAKMIRRHPHVFGEARATSSEEVLKNWEIIKRNERADGRPADSSVPSDLDGLPAMSALLTAKADRQSGTSRIRLVERG